jgi:hypothetical protein
MKDLITITITGTLLWWVMMWPDNSKADVIFDDNRLMISVKVFSF